MKKEFAPNICLECVKKNSGCCSCYPFIPLTIKDIKRIGKLGYNLKDFIHIEKYRKDWIDTSEKWWVNSFIEHDKKFYRITMKKKNDDSCYFLVEGKGCVLGKNRPYVCKIYPFWVNNKGKIIYEKGEDKDCLMGKKKVPITHAMNLIGEKKHLIKKYHKEIKHDCINNRNHAKKIVHEKIKVKIK